MTNPLTQLLDFIGSANAQKFIGLFGGPTLAVELNGLPTWVRAAFAVGGPLFAAVVHAVDAYRANGGGVKGTEALAAELPALKVDLSKAISFIETDVPGLKSRLSDVEAHAASIVAPIAPDAAAIEAAVRKVLASIVPPAPPA
jgi:hypothetical protein